MCQHLRRRHLTPEPLTLRFQFSQPGLYLIRHRRIEQVFHDHMPPLNESNQEPVSEKGQFSAVNRLNIRIGAGSKLTLCETGKASPAPGLESVFVIYSSPVCSPGPIRQILRSNSSDQSILSRSVSDRADLRHSAV